MRRAVKVAIIGSAGRKEDGPKMSRSLFEKMVLKTEQVIETFEHCKSDIELISGGSAWCDHIAVKLWLNDKLIASKSGGYSGLTLYLPCRYNVLSNNSISFVVPGNASNFKSSSPGGTLNALHTQFNYKMGKGFNSFSELFCAQQLGAVLSTDHQGFHARNLQVANVDYLITFTWSDSSLPKPGGTLDTWKHCKSKHKIHIPLSSLLTSTGIVSDNMNKYFSSDCSVAKAKHCELNQENNISNDAKRQKTLGSNSDISNDDHNSNM